MRVARTRLRGAASACAAGKPSIVLLSVVTFWIATTAGAARLGALDPADLIVRFGFDGPEEIAGAVGATRTGRYFVTASRLDRAGGVFEICGGSFGVVARGGDIAKVSFAETDGGLTSPAALASASAAVDLDGESAVAVAFSLPADRCVRVDSGGVAWLAVLDVEVVVRSGGGALELAFVDGLRPVAPPAPLELPVVTRLTGRLDGLALQHFPLTDDASADVHAGMRFLRGNVNGDSSVNIADATFLLNFLFLGGNDIDCAAAADANDDGRLDLGDAVYLLGYQFLGQRRPPAPFPGCGADPTQDGLSCERDGFCLAGMRNSAMLTWTAPTRNADGSILRDLAGYTIHWGPVPRAAVSGAAGAPYPFALDVDNLTTFVLDDLPSRTLYFAVTARDRSGNRSAYSAEGSKAFTVLP